MIIGRKLFFPLRKRHLDFVASFRCPLVPYGLSLPRTRNLRESFSNYFCVYCHLFQNSSRKEKAGGGKEQRKQQRLKPRNLERRKISVSRLSSRAVTVQFVTFGAATSFERRLGKPTFKRYFYSSQPNFFFFFKFTR